MEVLKFTLKGKTAFFKMPEVNTYYYFTYGNIHKVVLLGIFGAILGYGGYSQWKKNDKHPYPEFYRKLADIEVAIVPKENTKGYINKKIQVFNNSVGYASTEKGGNLVIKQQWLENPEWDIYVKIDRDEAQKIKESILSRKSVYIPYLGSNDHPAEILYPKILECCLVKCNEIQQMDSLFPEKYFEIDYEDCDVITPFKYSEYLPIGLNEDTQMYLMEKLIFTNFPIISHEIEVYDVDGKKISFI